MTISRDLMLSVFSMDSYNRGYGECRGTRDPSSSYVTPAVLKGERRQICDDLGCRASDILQANAVIWVEGPSDRIISVID